jgi:hypothetical protein
MNDLWTTLIPLVIASAVLPLQITVTILLAQGTVGHVAAAAWVAGMVMFRVGQGLVFGLVLGQGVAEAEGPARPGPIASTLLLVVGVFLLVSAVRSWLREPDDDAPPPRWMAVLGSATPGQAFAAGAVVVGASPKLWVFTLGAIGAIAEANLDKGAAAALYLAFTFTALSVHIAIVGLAYLSPVRAVAILGRMSDALSSNARPVKIALGLILGTWFLLKALAGLGLL